MRAGNRFVLSWPDWSGYILQGNIVSPNNTNAWFDLPDPVTVLNDRRVATNSIGNSTAFFRLRRPLP